MASAFSAAARRSTSASKQTRVVPCSADAVRAAMARWKHDRRKARQLAVQAVGDEHDRQRETPRLVENRHHLWIGATIGQDEKRVVRTQVKQLVGEHRAGNV